jgi:hypothetical protein
MLTLFPEGSRARAVSPYARPYPDPFRAPAGTPVVPDPTRRTDIEGWVWAEDPEGRGGWVPLAWLDRAAEPWRLTRAFDALELSVEVGDAVTVHYAESGFVMCTTEAGETGWLPDGVLERLD